MSEALTLWENRIKTPLVLLTLTRHLFSCSSLRGRKELLIYIDNKKQPPSKREEGERRGEGVPQSPKPVEGAKANEPSKRRFIQNKFSRVPLGKAYYDEPLWIDHTIMFDDQLHKGNITDQWWTVLAAIITHKVRKKGGTKGLLAKELDSWFARTCQQFGCCTLTIDKVHVEGKPNISNSWNYHEPSPTC